MATAATIQDPLKPKGFLATAMQPGATATTAPAAPATSAATPYIKPETDTVEGRLTGMLSKDSDYMKRAETKGLQTANKRGLLNSSMAVGAAQAASIDAALPVAQQDANTYSGFATRNQQVDQQKGLNEQQFGQQRTLDADKFAQERSVKQWEQDNLTFSQLIKGISDIQMQDMSPAAKETAVRELERIYSTRNSKIGASLLDVSIEDGKVVRPPTADGGAAGGTSAPTAQKSMFEYGSVAQMPPDMQAEYKSTFGNLDVATAQKVKTTADFIAYEYGPPPEIDRSGPNREVGSTEEYEKWLKKAYDEFRKAFGANPSEQVKAAMGQSLGIKR